MLEQPTFTKLFVGGVYFEIEHSWKPWLAIELGTIALWRRYQWSQQPLTCVPRSHGSQGSTGTDTLSMRKREELIRCILAKHSALFTFKIDHFFLERVQWKTSEFTGSWWSVLQLKKVLQKWAKLLTSKFKSMWDRRSSVADYDDFLMTSSRPKRHNAYSSPRYFPTTTVKPYNRWRNQQTTKEPSFRRR